MSGARIQIGDAREVLREYGADSFSAVVTDPPYHLVSGDKRPATRQCPHGHRRVPSAGFMGQAWDGGDIAADATFWAEVNRVMVPGAHLLAFGGTRTWHRMAVAIEDAGFEIRNTVAWLYASGFPKSLAVDDALDRKILGDWCDEYELERGPISHAAATYEGHGTDLKPALELIVVARKPLSEGTVAANVLAHGCGAINIDAGRVASGESTVRSMGGKTTRRIAYGAFAHDRAERMTGGSENGRWPANLAHDGSDEVMAAFARFGEAGSNGTDGYKKSLFAGGKDTGGQIGFGDTGTAARFFFSGKARDWERPVADNGERHATVKPVALMEWLVSLVTPPGGFVLDPFCGTGSTLAACDRLGFDCVGIDMQPEAEQWCRDRIERYRAHRQGGNAQPRQPLPGQQELFP